MSRLICKEEPMTQLTFIHTFETQGHVQTWRWFCCVDFLLIVAPIVGFCNCSMFCCVLLCVHSGFAIISMGKKDLVSLLCLSSWCLVIVVWLFFTITRVCLQFVIVVFPDHTHLLFLASTLSGLLHM